MIQELPHCTIRNMRKKKEEREKKETSNLKTRRKPKKENFETDFERNGIPWHRIWSSTFLV